MKSLRTALRLALPVLQLPLIVLPLHARASGEGCEPSWPPTFGGLAGTDGRVDCFALLDDGGGPELYVGGAFANAGGVAAANVARWDGAMWSALGDGVTGGAFPVAVCALAVFDDGGGPALFAGGTFTTAGGVPAAAIAKWDGASWSALGSGVGGVTVASVRALAVFDDGSGPALYAGGEFALAGGLSARRIARWDGSSWSALGTGMGGFFVPTVHALAVFDDGGGPALYAGGAFTTAGGTAANRIAAWDGASWSPVGSGMDAAVQSLAIFEDGSGPALVAGGEFTTAGGAAASRIAEWDGAGWSAMGSGVETGPFGPTEVAVLALATFDDGSGPALFAGGDFAYAGGGLASYAARWDGTSWAPLGGGLDATVHALLPFPREEGTTLAAGGEFGWAGGFTAASVAFWDGSAWAPTGASLNDAVRTLAAFDDGGGLALYAGGDFTDAGGVVLNHVGRWDGAGWSPLGSGTNNPVDALVVFDDGGGPALYASGEFVTAGGVQVNRIARWDGSAWSPLGGGISNGYVRCLAVFDDGSGPALYAGGTFTATGSGTAKFVARWDGATWSAVGAGMGSAVSVLDVFDDGSGPALHAGGSFLTAGGGPASHVARWDGSTWAPLGSGVGGSLPSVWVESLAVFDAGSGAALYAGGVFTTAGGSPASYVASWDGASWSPLGQGVDGLTPTINNVRALAVFDDGSGPDLYAGGGFLTAGGITANGIARWDGLSWSAVGSGVNSGVDALLPFDDGAGPALYAGGFFTSAIDSGDGYLARWGCPPITPVPGCFANPATLSALSGVPAVGQPLELELATVVPPSGLAFLFAGANGVDAGGCGLLVPGIGELLLTPLPAPLLVAQAPVAFGSAVLVPLVPDLPSLVGGTILLQAVIAAPPPGPALAASTGLLVTFAG